MEPREEKVDVGERYTNVGKSTEIYSAYKITESVKLEVKRRSPGTYTTENC